MLRKRVAFVTGAFTVSLVLAGCTNNTGEAAPTATTAKAQVITVDYEGKTAVPAADVTGAAEGGQAIITVESPFESTDPAALNVSTARAIGTNLLFRTLTTYLIDPETSKTDLVGDLASSAGVANDDDTEWTYTLRDGVSFEDGTPITSKDVAYGIARSFSTLGVAGEQNLQNALDPDRAYQGPYDGQLLPPGVTTPDDKTIVFTFSKPTPLLPYYLATANTSPVPAASDKRESYGTSFVSTGPYKLKEFVADQYMVLTRNEKWDAGTDPVRHQYPDSYRVEFNVPASTQTQRALAGQGTDANILSDSNVSQQDIPSVKANPKANLIAGGTLATYFIDINTQRVKDPNVRRALNFAIDRDGLAKARGGVNVASALTTVLAPSLPGYTASKTYKATPDVQAAKEALGGATPELTYCYANSTLGNGDAVVVQSSLEAAGFKIKLNPIEGASYVKTVRNPDSGCDMLFFSWAPPLPDASVVMNPLLNGATVGTPSNLNLSQFNEPSVNEQLGKLALESDRAAAAVSYGELDEKIMSEYAPMIPTVSENVYQIAGSAVKGSFADPIRASPSLVNLYLQK